MKTVRRSIGLGVLLVTVLIVLCISERAAGQQEGTAWEKALAKGRALLDEGRYDEALLAYDWRGNTMAEDLIERISQAEREGRTTDTLQLYQAYFDYFPFSHALFWYNKDKQWAQTLSGYTALLRKLPAEGLDESAREDLAAEDPWRRLWELAQDEARTRKSIQDQIFALADDIVGRFPKSRTCPGAVLVATQIAAFTPAETPEGTTEDPARRVRQIERYLDKMQRAGAPQRSRILVLKHLIWTPWPEGKDHKLLKRLNGSLEIVRTTDVSYDKRCALLSAGYAALEIGEEEGEPARKLFRDFLARYPSGEEADRARRGIVRTHLRLGKTDDALKAIRELEKDAPQDADFASALMEIVEAYEKQKDDRKALPLLTEISVRYPGSGRTAAAYLKMADIHKRAGDGEKMIACWKQAAAFKSSARNRVYAADSIGRAHSHLADHYLQNKQWAEALTWYEAWKPTSWCGTCLEGMNTRRTYNIAVCKMMVGRADEVTGTLEKAVYWPTFWTGDADIPRAFVDTWHKRGKLREIEGILKVLAEREKNPGAKAALEYVGRLRKAR